MDLRQLRFFLEIARYNNFTKAAEQLHVAQPAVSMAIKKLEEELDLVLFSRQEKKIALTAEGEIFLARARKILDEVAATEAEMEELRGLAKGEVRVGIPPMMGAFFFPRIISEFSEKYPNLQLAVYGEGAAKIQKMIIQGELDMGVIAGAGYHEALEMKRFLREEVVVCVPKDHPLKDRSSITFREFAGEKLLFYKEGYYLREMVLDVLKDYGVKPKVAFESNLFSLNRSLVQKGMGVSIFLKMVVADDPELRIISFDPPLYLDLMIAWKRRGYLSRANRAFADFLLAQAPSNQPED
ncbi:LysR family transcriptional regulator [Geomesophilobacter sediminis]|uniref:LysR family transcriptional regulator n=1 Tax=Geomesophilobacter sediminis TaxID=2798584 RepID=A0A8J7IP69_9BACT|nr:LysR family transcriptional regulator [Geomesophilobacter sediminis]MBJ6724054.1 LysR family transcriptional regulator [Geomesophilobacter sediminis]